MRTPFSLLIGIITLLSPVLAFAQSDDYGTAPVNSSPYCPSLVQTLQKGDRDARTVPTGQVSELQAFLTDYYDLDENILVGGYFGNLTKQYVVKFQTEKGLPAFGIAGSMTRAAIVKACGGSNTTQTGTTAGKTATAQTETTVVAAPSVPATAPEEIVAQAGKPACSLTYAAHPVIEGSFYTIAYRHAGSKAVLTHPDGHTQELTKAYDILKFPATARGQYRYGLEVSNAAGTVLCGTTVQILPPNARATIDTSSLTVESGKQFTISGTATNIGTVHVGVISYAAAGLEAAVPGAFGLEATVRVLDGKYSYNFPGEIPDGKYMVTVSIPSEGVPLTSGILVVGNVAGTGVFRMYVNDVLKKEEANVSQSYAEATCKLLTNALYAYDKVSCAYANTTFFTQAATASKPSAQLDNPNMTTAETMPSVAGTAQNVDAVIVSVGSETDTNVSYTMSATVTAGRFSAKIPTALAAGTYAVVVTSAKTSLVLAQGKIVVGSGTTSTSDLGTLTIYENGELSYTISSYTKSSSQNACNVYAAAHLTAHIRCKFNGTEFYAREAQTTSTTPTVPTTPTTPTVPTGDTGNASVDLKINGSDGPLALNEGDPVTVTWSSSGMKSCGVYGVWPSIGVQYANVPTLPSTSGSAQYYAYVPGYPNFVVRLRCMLTVPTATTASMDDTVVVTKATVSSNTDALANLASALVALQSILSAMR